MKKIIVILSLCMPAFGLFNDIHQNPWEFLKDRFITKPQLEVSSTRSRLTRWGLTATAGTAGLYGAHKGINKLVEQSQGTALQIDMQQKRNRVAAGAALVGSTLIPACMAYGALTSFALERAEYRALEEFVKEWESNRGYAPAHLHHNFDELAALYERDRATFKKEAPDVVRLIKNAVVDREQKPAPRESFSLTKFFDHKIMTTSVIANFGHMLEGIGSIIRSVKH